MQDTGLLLREDPIDGLGPSPEVSTQAFQLADNAVSPALRVSRGWVFVTVTGRSSRRTCRSSPKCATRCATIWCASARRKSPRPRPPRSRRRSRARRTSRPPRRRPASRSKTTELDHTRVGDSRHRRQRRRRQGRLHAAQGRRQRSDLDAARHGDRARRRQGSRHRRPGRRPASTRREPSSSTSAAIASSAPTWPRRRRS